MPRERLYSRETGNIIRREAARSRRGIFVVLAIVMGALLAVLHHEMPFLAYWTQACSPHEYAYKCPVRMSYSIASGAAFGVLMAVILLLLNRYRRVPPTIRCRACGMSGWVLDLVPHGGRCPHCAGERFDYQIWFGSGTAAGPRLERVREYDVAGADLVVRFEKTRHDWERRYY